MAGLGELLREQDHIVRNISLSSFSDVDLQANHGQEVSVFLVCKYG